MELDRRLGVIMGQFGFFDLGDRYAGLDKFGDPLVLSRRPFRGSFSGPN